MLDDFQWLVDLICRSDNSPSLPRIMVFFTNVNHLVDAYQCVTVRSGQKIGTGSPQIVMFHLTTGEAIKQAVIDDLGNRNGKIKVVFCTSSLSMGMNLANIEYIIHYGIPNATDSFLQESGRAAREAGSHGHSILLSFPKMAAGRRIDKGMKKYAAAETCLRQTLLDQFDCVKPANQNYCCDVCDDTITCEIKNLILDSFDSSIAESFSDTLSVDSVANLDDFV